MNAILHENFGEHILTLNNNGKRDWFFGINNWPLYAAKLNIVLSIAELYENLCDLIENTTTLVFYSLFPGFSRR